jgi:hypothetical protein
MEFSLPDWNQLDAGIPASGFKGEQTSRRASQDGLIPFTES